VQCPLDFILPGQGVHDLVQADRDLKLAQGFAALVEQAQVGHHPQRIGHRNYTALDLDPIPRDPGGAVVCCAAPKCLAATGRVLVAKTQTRVPR